MSIRSLPDRPLPDRSLPGRTLPGRSLPGRRLRVVDWVLRRLSCGGSSVEAEVAALDDLLAEGDVCCDIGASFGLYTLAAARSVGPTGRVLAFEPLAGPRRFLAQSVRWLRATNVEVHPEALGDERRAARMSLPTRRGLPVPGRAFVADHANGLGSNLEFAHQRSVEVGVSKLDSVVEQRQLHRVDLVKIDVEGYELAVLRGAARTLRRFHPVVLLEIEDRHLARFGADSSMVVDAMAGYGYRMHALVDGRWQAMDAVTDRRRNYLFVPG